MPTVRGWTERALLACMCDVDISSEPVEPADPYTCPEHGATTVEKVARVNWTTGADLFRRERRGA